MAEAKRLPDGDVLLIENHCPICVAAKACQGFCRSELNLFRDVLGPEVHVEREEHILSGARRCAYRLSRVK
jgi:predicted ArsR family transcriptional regulator